MPDTRTTAIDAYLRAYRSAERAAVEWVTGYLADDVLLVSGNNEIKGKEALRDRLGTIFPSTPTYVSIGFSDPAPGPGGSLVVEGVMPPLGAAPQGVTLQFEFNDKDQISRIEETTKSGGPAGEASPTIQPVMRGLINGALANNTPMTFAYVDADGLPHVSLRGGVQVYSPTQLSIWLRPTDHSAASLATNPNVALLYRDSRVRTTLVVRGMAHVDDSPEVRERVYNLIPEVEQSHDVARNGQALIIDVDEIRGGHVFGQLHMKRA